MRPNRVYRLGLRHNHRQYSDRQWARRDQGFNIVGKRPPDRIIYQVTGMQVTVNTIIVAKNSSDIATGLLDYANPPEPGIFSDPTNVWTGNIYVVPALPWTKQSWMWGENGGTTK